VSVRAPCGGGNRWRRRLGPWATADAVENIRRLLRLPLVGEGAAIAVGCVQLRRRGTGRYGSKAMDNKIGLP
jgi:hypothetical protein